MLGSVALIMALAAPSGATTPADSPNLYGCADSSARVQSHQPVDLREICHGAQDALTFFADLGIEAPHPLTVEVVARLPDAVGETAVGCYLESEQRILVLAFAVFRKSETWFNVPVDRNLYRSLVTHEVAHAVADCAFAITSPTIQAKEYLAYIAMFATMDGRLRERIMIANPGTGFDSEMKINATIYLCDPMRFGVQAYRHYLQKEHGTAFLRDVLAGKALTD